MVAQVLSRVAAAKLSRAVSQKRRIVVTERKADRDAAFMLRAEHSRRWTEIVEVNSRIEG